VLPNKTLHSDFNGRLPLGLGPLPESVFNQLGGKSAITGIAGIPENVLLPKQLMGCRQVHGEYITIKAGELCR